MQAIPLDLYEELEGLDPKIKSVFLKLFEYLIKERVTKDDFQRLTEKVEKLADIVAELAVAQKKTEEELKALSKTVAELVEAQKKTDEELKTQSNTMAELSKTVSELSKTVAELVEAQKRTDQRVAELAEAQKRTDQRVAELAEAQKRTEEELKALSKTVAELAEAQKRTDQKVAELAEAQRRTEQKVAELAEAQKRTDQRLAELAEAQKRTDQRLAELAEAQKRTEEEVRTLAQELKRTRQDLGGLSLSFSYAFENEAYRMLPQVLKKYGLELEDKMIRKEVAGEEINFFATAKRNGKTVYIVGETKLRLDDTKKRDDVFKQLEKKISAVKKVYGDVQIVPLIVTHFAKASMLKKAKERGIIVVQSYEW
jgi:chromosome segregation ATPase